MTDARVALVVKAVSAYFDIPTNRIRTYRGSDRMIILYKQIAIYLCWKLFRLKNALLLSEFHIRDASVLLYSIYKIETLRVGKDVFGLCKALEELTSIISELDVMRRSV